MSTQYVIELADLLNNLLDNKQYSDLVTGLSLLPTKIIRSIPASMMNSFYAPIRQYLEVIRTRNPAEFDECDIPMYANLRILKFDECLKGYLEQRIMDCSDLPYLPVIIRVLKLSPSFMSHNNSKEDNEQTEETKWLQDIVKQSCKLFGESYEECKLPNVPTKEDKIVRWYQHMEEMDFVQELEYCSSWIAENLSN